MKKLNNSPTEINQRVKLRGRPAVGEIVSWIDGKDYTWCVVAWDYESYLIEPPVKGMVYGYITPQELELT